MCRFKAKLATMFGVNVAIICQYLWEITKGRSHRKDTLYKDGKLWVRCPQSTLTAVFPFLTKSRVQAALSLLMKEGIIKKACLSSCKFDHTAWYAFTERGIYIMKDAGKVGRYHGQKI